MLSHMLLETNLILMNVFLGYIKSNCQPSYPERTPTHFFTDMYLDTLRDRQPETSYHVSDRYHWIKHFKYQIPCGTMDYNYDSPIYNGTDAPENSWPWQALVSYPGSLCGGVLIDSQWVLTAAHCVEEKDVVVTVYFGTRYRDFRDYVSMKTASSVVTHDEHNTKTLANDIALLKLESPVTFNLKVRPACLPVDGQDFSMNDRCYLTGIGDRKIPGEVVLQQARVYVVPDKECSILYRILFISPSWRNICAGRVQKKAGTCYGDSGGPLSCEIGNRYYVAGVINSSPKNCSSDIIPDKHTKVTEYINWIFHTMETFRDKN
ncbi:Transmembrane protease serine 13 [Bulinus truncatus]|nr:Transmembrane protease serine 13 [Bulinus truncatus]